MGVKFGGCGIIRVKAAKIIMAGIINLFIFFSLLENEKSTDLTNEYEDPPDDLTMKSRWISLGKIIAHTIIIRRISLASHNEKSWISLILVRSEVFS